MQYVVMSIIPMGFWCGNLNFDSRRLKQSSSNAIIAFNKLKNKEYGEKQ